MANMKLLAPGHATCAGCGPAIAIRQMLEATGKDIIICCATGCIEVTSSQAPLTAWKVPWIHATFENAVPVASGIKAALEYEGNAHTQVIALSGDGGLADIGFGALSGALERKDDILIICYDNEAYQNTGNQRSSTTPMYAATSTTPAGKLLHGKRQPEKNMAAIVAAHNVPYVATTSIAYLKDLKSKIKKAMSIKGPRFIHIHCPCLVGWKFDSSETIEIARLAVKTRMWRLFEIENGKYKINYEPKERVPVEKFLRIQGRFSHLFRPENKHVIEELQKHVDSEWEKLKKKI